MTGMDKKTTKPSLLEFPLPKKGKKINFIELDRKIDWDSLESLVDYEILESKPTHSQFITCIALMVISYSLHAGDYKKTFQLAKDFKNKFLSHYHHFAVKSVDFWDITDSMIKEVHEYIEQKDLRDKFSSNKELINPEPLRRDMYNIVNTTRCEAII